MGAGGIDSNLAFTLLGCGFKNFVIVDRDTINERNVILSSPFYRKDIGRNKAEVVAERLKEKYEGVRAEAFACWDYEVPVEAFAKCDIIVLGVDSNAARQRVNALNMELGKPIINIGFWGWEASCTIFVPKKTACWSCLWRPNDANLKSMNKRRGCPKPEPNVPGAVIKGTIDEIVGFAAKQAVKLVTGQGRLGQYHAFDTLTDASDTRFMDSDFLQPDAECPVCSMEEMMDVAGLK